MTGEYNNTRSLLFNLTCNDRNIVYIFELSEVVELYILFANIRN